VDPNSDQQIQSNNVSGDDTNQPVTVTNDQALTNLNTSAGVSDMADQNTFQEDTPNEVAQPSPVDSLSGIGDISNTDSSALKNEDVQQNDVVLPESLQDTQPLAEFQPSQPQGIPTVTEPTIVSSDQPLADQPKWDPENDSTTTPTSADIQSVTEDSPTLEVHDNDVPLAATQPYASEPAIAQSQLDNAMQQPMQTLASEQTSEKENIYTEICSQIIREQEKIIGALAIEQADQVDGLAVNPVTYHCVVTGDGSKVINDLIEQYRDFFGHAAVEVCKEAASKFLTKLPANETPELLR
jgi:hypothetical protein